MVNGSSSCCDGDIRIGSSDGCSGITGGGGGDGRLFLPSPMSFIGVVSSRIIHYSMIIMVSKCDGGGDVADIM